MVPFYHLVVIVIVYGFVLNANCHLLLSHRKGFEITKAGLNEHEVHFRTKNGMFASCRVKMVSYDCKETKEKKPNRVVEKRNETPDWDKKMTLQNRCVEKKEGYFKFQVCLGDKVRQFHNADEYLLGYFNRDLSVRKMDDELVFDNGQVCENGSKKPRRTIVKMMCGMSLDLQNIQEPDTCEYYLIVTHPDLCSNGNGFETFHASQASRQAISYKQATFDPWQLEITQSLDGEYTCVARNILKDVHQQQTWCFRSVELDIQENGESLSVDEVEARHDYFTLYNVDSHWFSEGNRVSVSLDTQSTDFVGSLEYLRVYSRKE